MSFIFCQKDKVILKKISLIFGQTGNNSHPMSAMLNIGLEHNKKDLTNPAKFRFF